MKQNMGKTDRAIRIQLAVIIAGLGLYFNSWWGLIAIIPGATALGDFVLYTGYWELAPARQNRRSANTRNDQDPVIFIFAGNAFLNRLIAMIRIPPIFNYDSSFSICFSFRGAFRDPKWPTHFYTWKRLYTSLYASAASPGSRAFKGCRACFY